MHAAHPALPRGVVARTRAAPSRALVAVDDEADDVSPLAPVPRPPLAAAPAGKVRIGLGAGAVRPPPLARLAGLGARSAAACLSCAPDDRPLLWAPGEARGRRRGGASRRSRRCAAPTSSATSTGPGCPTRAPCSRSRRRRASSCCGASARVRRVVVLLDGSRRAAAHTMGDAPGFGAAKNRRGPRRGRVGVGQWDLTLPNHAGDEARRDPGLLRRVLRRLRRARARVPGERPDLRPRRSSSPRRSSATSSRGSASAATRRGARLREPAALPLPRAGGRRRRLRGRRLRGAARRRRRRERDGVERRRRGPDGGRAAPRGAGRAEDARRRRSNGRAAGGQSQFHVPRRRDTGDGPRRSRAGRQGFTCPRRTGRTTQDRRWFRPRRRRRRLP